MNWRTNISHLLWLMAVACTSPTADESIEATYNTSHLIEIDKFKALQHNDSVVVIDFRNPDEYAAGHIPGALNIWRPDIENDSLPYNGVVAPKQKIEKLFGGLGIRNDDFLIIYDNNASCDAARLWWVLDYYGYQKTALLHGGLKAWSEVGELSSKTVTRRASEFILPSSPLAKHYISLSEMTKTYSDPAVKVIDNRSEAEYQGLYMKTNAFDSGRIKGSIHIDWLKTVNYAEQTFMPKSYLRNLFESNGIDSLSDIIVYCHSGVRSAHTVFVLTELLGYKNVRNYEGSWVEWSYHQMPVEREDLPITNL